ncbi:MAG TPA: tryptophan synthase subunit alpha [Polyangiaceae bacterium]|nr:tryptophan synthase subunit alpha [Polyangiaceae bacterium]
MSRLGDVFARAGRKPLVAYLCVGDPGVDESVELALTCARAGADVLELGVPFSDPTADGPAIQRASQRAIAAGGGFDATLRAVAAVRAAEPRVGVVVFGYYNPIFVHGEDRAAADAASAGADALLVVDLPIEESATLREAARRHGIGVVPLLAPTSRGERVAAVKEASRAGGVPFVYYVSVTGVTGAGEVDAAGAGAHAARLREELELPVVVGFGIDSADKARAAAAGADGVVVGSAIVRVIEDARSAAERRAGVERLVRELRAGLDAS